MRNKEALYLINFNIVTSMERETVMSMEVCFLLNMQFFFVIKIIKKIEI
jgi:hypothetical protein